LIHFFLFVFFYTGCMIVWMSVQFYKDFFKDFTKIFCPFLQVLHRNIVHYFTRDAPLKFNRFKKKLEILRLGFKSLKTRGHISRHTCTHLDTLLVQNFGSKRYSFYKLMCTMVIGIYVQNNAQGLHKKCKNVKIVSSLIKKR